MNDIPTDKPAGPFPAISRSPFTKKMRATSIKIVDSTPLYVSDLDLGRNNRSPFGKSPNPSAQQNVEATLNFKDSSDMYDQLASFSHPYGQKSTRRPEMDPVGVPFEFCRPAMKQQLVRRRKQKQPLQLSIEKVLHSGSSTSEPMEYGPRSIETPFTVQTFSDFHNTHCQPKSELEKTMSSAFPRAKFSDDTSKQIGGNFHDIPSFGDTAKHRHSGKLEKKRGRRNSGRFKADKSNQECLSSKKLSLQSEKAALLLFPSVALGFSDIDLARSVGVSPDDLSEESIQARKITISHKLKQAGYMAFTVLEEYDIHNRAEVYVASIMPDPQYICLKISSEELQQYEQVEQRDQQPPIAAIDGTLPPSLKRRRRAHRDCVVVHRNRNSSMNDNSRILPEGTKLYKPKNKLVQLVAQAIQDSPDGMLQVQQVYLALQNKYPYFRNMDKASVTSWRSSIRHALYQKWFRKIPFRVSAINSKGCYWAINHYCTPREWNLPSLSSSDVDVLGEEWTLIPPQSSASPFTEGQDITAILESQGYFEFPATDFQPPMCESPCEDLQMSPQQPTFNIPQPPPSELDPTLAMLGAGAIKDNGGPSLIELSPVVPCVTNESSQESGIGVLPDLVTSAMESDRQQNTVPDSDYNSGTSWEQYQESAQPEDSPDAQLYTLYIPESPLDNITNSYSGPIIVMPVSSQ